MKGLREALTPSFGTTPFSTRGDTSKSAANTVVDVVVPVFNALDDTRRCLTTLFATDPGCLLRALVINDGSDQETTQWLREFARGNSNVRLIEHPENQGYTRAVNSGLRASQSAATVLLNSDTIVAPGWLAGLLRCVESSDNVGIVGPLSNAASWQSVPHVKDRTGKFAINQLPLGLTVNDMSEVVAAASRHEYPRVPVVNGFCFLITRATLDAVGLMDEERFPVGFGEENDYCLRAADAGFELRIADDVYVHHAKSKSFGHHRRKRLSDEGMLRLIEKYGQARVDEVVEDVAHNAVLADLRKRIQAALDARQAERCGVDPLSMKILFLLPAKGGSGGAHSVIQEAAHMRKLGLEVRVAVRPEDYPRFVELYDDVASVETMLVRYDSSTVLDVAEGFDVVVATVYVSVSQLAEVARAYPETLPAYYVQDYEPLFFEEGSRQRREAMASYTQVEHGLLFAKTQWIADQVRKHHGASVSKVLPSLDHDVYFPAPREESAALRVAAMIRPQTPRRAAQRTMQVLRDLSQKRSGDVTIHLFGCDASEPAFQALVTDFPFINYGVLTRSEVASLLRRVDVFVDLSEYQAFGRTGLEAMASGCAVVLPKRGGTDEFARDGYNALLVDTDDEEQCVERLAALLGDPALVLRLRRNGLVTASGYSVHGAVMCELSVLAEALARHRSTQPKKERHRLALVVERDHEGPSRSAYLRLLPWRAPSLREHWAVGIAAEGELPAPGSAEIAIVQAGAHAAEPAPITEWLEAWRAAGGKLVLDIDDGAGELGLETELAREASTVHWLASVADAVTVATPSLRQNYLGINPAVFVVPSRLDATLWSGGRDPRAQRRSELARVRIGCLPTAVSDHGLERLQKPLRRLLSAHHERLSVEVVRESGTPKVAFGRRLELPLEAGYPDRVAWIVRNARWDIGLLPLDASTDAHAAQIAFAQYTALGVVVVASDVPAAREVLRHGDNALLVQDNTEAWYEALSELIEHPQLQTQLLDAAVRDLQQRYFAGGPAEADLAVLDGILDLAPRLDTPLALGTHRRSAPTVSSYAPPKPVVTATPAPRAGNGAARPSRMPFAIQRASELAELRTAMLKRKFRKFQRDPESFFADSKSPVVRALSGLIRSKS